MSDTQRDPRVAGMAEKMQEYFLSYEPTQWRLILWVVRQVAQGRPLSAEQVTATFLQDFFSWDGAESDQTYITGWAKFVAPRVVATLDTAAPRLLLDSGNDSAAQSPAPTISAGSAQIQGQNAQVQAAWTIQVAPPAAEQVIWQTRQVQATVWLTQSGTTWLVTNLTWQSNGS